MGEGGFNKSKRKLRLKEKGEFWRKVKDKESYREHFIQPRVPEEKKKRWEREDMKTQTRRKIGKK